MNQFNIKDLNFKKQFENPYVIAIDMDGTLLSDDKTISHFTIETLQKLKLQNYKLFICSGRSFNGVYKYEQIREIIDYYICFEGSYVVDNKTLKSNPTVIFKQPLENEYLTKVLEIFKKYEIMLALISDTYGYCFNCDEEVINSVKIWGAIPKIEDIQNFKLTNDIEIYLLLVYGSPKIINNLLEDLKNNNCSNFEIINAFLKEKQIQHLVLKKLGINKWNGLKIALNHSGDEAKNLIAFGDWHNDIEMIKNANIGVAMKNAEPEIISVSNYVTKYDNNNDGVARFLNELILNKSCS